MKPRWILCLLVLFLSAPCARADDQSTYEPKAANVMQYIQQNLYNRSTGLYYGSSKNHQTDFMWGNGITFSALVGAARHDPQTYLPIMQKFFSAMDRYWDAQSPIPGYEPSPTNGNGHDKYYDDNEWMVITFAEAYAQTKDQRYLARSVATLKFALSGWDDQLGGGIWWHEGHKGGGKNTCSNGPAAEGCVCVAKYVSANQASSDITAAKKIVAWTDEHLEANDGLYGDNVVVATGKKNGGKLTYNTALMIRAKLGLYRVTGDEKYLDQAKRSAKAADWFLDRNTGAYRDNVKWSHLMVEADLDLYRTTHEPYLLDRARKNADYFYESWKANHPVETIENSSVARMLWLLADTETERGRQFWKSVDEVSK